MAGKRGEQPGLIVVGNDELVVGVGALFVNESADELDSLAGRAALAKDDAGVDVFADACFGQGSAAFASSFMLVLSVAEQETPFSLIPASE